MGTQLNAGSHSYQESSGIWTISANTDQGQEGKVRTCFIMATPSYLGITPENNKSQATDLTLGIIQNDFKDKNTMSFRFQFFQSNQAADIKYFEDKSKGELSFNPSSMSIALNENLGTGVGSPYLKGAEVNEFKKRFKAASELVLTLGLAGKAKGKAVFSLKGSLKGINKFDENC